MNSIQTRMTAPQLTSAPSTFGMPACGHATDVARIKGDMGRDLTILAVRTYPGSYAWSPPPS